MTPVTEARGRISRMLIRGLATPHDLGEACDELGIGQGQTFVLCPPEALQDGALRGIADDMLPAHNAPTALKAATDHYPRSGSCRFKVAVLLADYGPLSSDQITARFGMNLYTVKPRLTELRKGGFAQVVGRRKSPRGSDTDVYELTVEGWEAVAKERGGEVRP